ncbi:MAG: hypothetical protein Q9171_002498 [Xanthocarpia ochracea]
MATTKVLIGAEVMPQSIIAKAALVDLVVQVVPPEDFRVHERAFHLLQAQIGITETRLHSLVKSLEQRRTDTLTQLQTIGDSLRGAAALVEDWNETTKELIRKLNTSLDNLSNFLNWLLIHCSEDGKGGKYKKPTAAG